MELNAVSSIFLMPLVRIVVANSHAKALGSSQAYSLVNHQLAAFFT
jgi:hypothetical protein